MVSIGEKYKKTPLIYLVLISIILILGCIYSIDKVDTMTGSTPIKEDAIIYDCNAGTSTHIFKVNDEDMMYDVDIRLLGLSNKESVAFLMIDNVPHQVPYNADKIIKDHIIKVTDIDNNTQSAKITVKHIK